jgi:hypothetical protein
MDGRTAGRPAAATAARAAGASPPEHCTDCPLRAAGTKNPQAGRAISRGEHEDEIEGLRQRMQAAAAKDLDRLRRQTAERVNADGKAHRRLRRFSGRGLARARGQVGRMVLAHNRLTLLSEEDKVQRRQATPVKPDAYTT